MGLRYGHNTIVWALVNLDAIHLHILSRYCDLHSDLWTGELLTFDIYTEYAE